MIAAAVVLFAAAVLWAPTICVASVTVRFAATQQQPPADLPADARASGTTPESTSGNIYFRVVSDPRDHGPLGRVLTDRLVALEITWWDRALFGRESVVEDFLRRVVGSAKGSTNNFVPWAQRLPVPSVAMTVEETEGRRGRLLVWYGWPSVYTAYHAGDGAWWFSHWINVDELRVMP